MTCATSRDEGFLDGVILGLLAMAAVGETGSSSYAALLHAAGRERVIRRAEETLVMDAAGLSDFLQEEGGVRGKHVDAGAALAQPVADTPVAWQCRGIGRAWSLCSREHHDYVKAHPEDFPDYEVRALYAEPKAAPGVDLGRLQAVVSEMSNYIDQDAFLDLDVVEIWRDRLLLAMFGVAAIAEERR